jgi:hypothetical protein
MKLFNSVLGHHVFSFQSVAHLQKPHVGAIRGTTVFRAVGICRGFPARKLEDVKQLRAGKDATNREIVAFVASASRCAVSNAASSGELASHDKRSQSCSAPVR